MINRGRALIFLREDTSCVPAPAIVSGRYCQAKRSLLEPRLYFLNHVLATSVRYRGVIKHFGLNHFILSLVSAFLCSGLIWIVFSGLGADFRGHFPVVGHPATVAAVRFFVAVNALLLRKANWLLVVLDGLDGLLDSGCGEGPAGAAASLVLNGTQILAFPPINVVVLLILEETTTFRIFWFHIVLLVLSCSWDSAEHIKVLLIGHVCRSVQSERGIGVVSLHALDFLFVAEVDSNTIGQLFSALVVLVVGADEAEELRIDVVWQRASEAD